MRLFKYISIFLALFLAACQTTPVVDLAKMAIYDGKPKKQLVRVIAADVGGYRGLFRKDLNVKSECTYTVSGVTKDFVTTGFIVVEVTDQPQAMTIKCSRSYDNGKISSRQLTLYTSQDNFMHMDPISEVNVSHIRSSARKVFSSFVQLTGTQAFPSAVIIVLERDLKNI